jgi:hypothetical protein
LIRTHSAGIRLFRDDLKGTLPGISSAPLTSVMMLVCVRIRQLERESFERHRFGVLHVFAHSIGGVDL